LFCFLSKMNDPKESQDDANESKEPNEYLTLVAKKIRSLKKKMTKIEEIEKKATTSVINEQQRKVLDNKDNVAKSLEEFESLKAQMLKTYQQEEKIQRRLAKRKTETTSKEKQQSVASLVQLVHLTQLLRGEDSAQHVPLFFAEQERVRSSGGTTLVTSEIMLDSLSLFANSIFKASSNLSEFKQNVEKAQEIAQNFLAQNEEEAIPGFSYKVLSEHTKEIYSSPFYLAKKNEEVNLSESQMEQNEKEEETIEPSQDSEPVAELKTQNEVLESTPENGKITTEGGESTKSRGFRGRGRGGRGRGGPRYSNHEYSDDRGRGRGGRDRERGRGGRPIERSNQNDKYKSTN